MMKFTHRLTKHPSQSAKKLAAIFLIAVSFSSGNALATDGTCNNCGIIKAVQGVTTTLNALHNTNVTMLNDIINAVDNWIQKISTTNNELLTSKQNADSAVSSNSANLVNYYLSGIGVKDNESLELSKISAADTDNLVAPSTSYTASVFAVTPDNAKASSDTAAAISAGTAIMNTDTLLGTRRYNEQQKNNAQLLLRYIEAILPPPDIIRISSTFDVPFSTEADKSTTKIEITGRNNEEHNSINDLVATLNTKPDYRKYKVEYRAAIAMRTMLLNNLLRAYQARVAPTGKNGKSAAEIDYESATWRLSPAKSSSEQSYYDSMKQASPVVINREILFLLAEMRYDSYQLRQQNEQLIALLSLVGLKTTQDMMKNSSSSSPQQIGKLIYCWKNPDAKTCSEKFQNAPSSPQMQR